MQRPNQKRIDAGLYWDRAWSLVSGCTPVSEGCLNCCSAREAHMRRNNPAVRGLYEGLTDPGGKWNGTVWVNERILELPLEVKKPQVWSIWTDLFHEQVPFDFSLKAFDVMSRCQQHVFIVCTKRPERALEFCVHWGLLPYPDMPAITPSGECWPDNVIAMTTAENQKWADIRVPILLAVPAKYRAVSYEPALGPVDFSRWLPGSYECSYTCGFRAGADYDPIIRCSQCGHEAQEDEWGNDRCEEICPNCEARSDAFERICPDCGETLVHDHPDTQCLSWIVAGGETGPSARPAHPDWFRSVRDQCVAAEVPYFHKHNGEWTHHLGIAEGKAREPMQQIRLTIQGKNGSDLAHSRDGGDVWMYRVGKSAAGRLLDGRTWEEMPE